MYAFRGADIRNILDFERDFSDAAVIRLEQNYRSTQRILDAANAVIAHNANRLEKRLWSDLGDGEPVRVIEVQDEQAEARLVAARIGGLLDEGVAAREVAVFYRTNAQSRVLEDLLVRHGVPYQVIGGARFYERAEIKDAMAYLQALDNPADSVSLRRVDQPAAPRHRRLEPRAPRRARERCTAGRSGTRSPISRRPASRPPPSKAVRGFRTLIEQLRSEVAGLGVGDAVERVLERSGLVAALEAERDASAQGRIEAGSRLENLQELVGVAQEYEPREEEPTLVGLPAGGLAVLRGRRDRARVGPRHADDPAQREGPRVRGGLRARARAEPVPARALDRGGEPRGGAPPLLRRDHAGARAA